MVDLTDRESVIVDCSPEMCGPQEQPTMLARKSFRRLRDVTPSLVRSSPIGQSGRNVLTLVTEVSERSREIAWSPKDCDSMTIPAKPLWKSLKTATPNPARCGLNGESGPAAR